MSDGIFNADLDQYLRAAGIDGPPPAIASDALVAGLTPTEQLLRILGLAANADDPADAADSVAQQSDRDVGATESARAFATEDERAGADLNGTAAQIPQLIAGIAGAVAGALGGALQSLGQLPQALGQIAPSQGANQIEMDGYREGAEPDLPFDEPFDAFSDTEFGDTWAGGGGDGAAGGAGVAGGGLGGVPGTMATGVLGPPPVPSAGTAPASAPALRISPPGTGAAPPPAAAGMAGMPLIPPGAMNPATAGDKDAKTETKRVSVPTVRNGAPIQGRLVPPPAAPTVVKRVEGKPVATKRVVAPALE